MNVYTNVCVCVCVCLFNIFYLFLVARTLLAEKFVLVTTSTWKHKF